MVPVSFHDNVLKKELPEHIAEISVRVDNHRHFMFCCSPTYQVVLLVFLGTLSNLNILFIQFLERHPNNFCGSDIFSDYLPDSNPGIASMQRQI